MDLDFRPGVLTILKKWNDQLKMCEGNLLMCLYKHGAKEPFS